MDDSKRVTINVRLPAELIARIDEIRAREHRSRNKQIEHMLAESTNAVRS
jgi:hypothetical protein